jgi:hypothetical protein
MEPESSLAFLKEPATDHFPGPDESNPRPQTLFSCFKLLNIMENAYIFLKRKAVSKRDIL